MNPVLTAALALAGLASGPALRTVIARYADPACQDIPAGDPARQDLPAGHPARQDIPAGHPACQDIPAGDPACQDIPAGDPACHGGASCARPPSARILALAARGRCPGCGQRTGPPPLAVEVTTALLLGALAARVHPGLVLAAACWLALCCVPLAFIDAAVRRLPDVLTGAAFGGTALLLLAAAAAGGHWHVLARAVLGGVALAGFYLLLALISPAGMGLGDVKAATGLGTMLAWRGWTALIAGGFAGFLLAAVYGTALLISRRATRKHQIPFGPFMITGAFLVILTWPV